MDGIAREYGPFAIVNIIIAFSVIFLTIKNAAELYFRKRKERLPGLDIKINAILFWSGLMVTLGFLQAFWGIFCGIDSIIVAGNSDPIVILALIASELRLIIFSLSFFSVFMIVWYVLWSRYRKLLSQNVLT